MIHKGSFNLFGILLESQFQVKSPGIKTELYSNHFEE
jgi:hypothetical protein